MKPLVPHPQARRAAFDHILAQIRPAGMEFAVTHGLEVADSPTVPDLSGVDLGSALMLHVAAVVSLLTPAGWPPEAAGRPLASDLINRILDLECERRWLYESAAAGRMYRPIEEAFGDLARGDCSAVETAVAAATLAGAPTLHAAMQLITCALDVEQARARKIARWLHQLYPDAEVGPDATWLPPLQPDLLGEELVARVIRRQLAEGTPPAQLLPRKLMRGDPGLLAPTQLRRLLTVLIRSGSRDRGIADLVADGNGHGGLLGDLPDEIDLSVVEDAMPRTNTNLRGCRACTSPCMQCGIMTKPTPVGVSLTSSLR